jgi:excisionase family DNA binding protein
MPFSDRNETREIDRSDDVMTVDDVAQYLRVHRVTIYRLVNRGGLPGFKVGRIWRFRPGAIVALQSSRPAELD